MAIQPAPGRGCSKSKQWLAGLVTRMGSGLRTGAGLRALVLRMDGGPITDRTHADGPDLAGRQEIDMRLGDKREVIGVEKQSLTISADVVRSRRYGLLNLINDQVHILGHRAKATSQIKRDQGVAAFSHVFGHVVEF